MKNYIGFVNDHSGSMASLTRAAMNDYNANITAVREAASREMLDTVVSVVGLGLPHGAGVKRQVVISNPHVLKPINQWPTPGGTPLYDAVGNMIELFESLPDADSRDVSFLIIVTTDGEELHSEKYKYTLVDHIQRLQRDGRWTFVFRVPKGARHTIEKLGVPLDNIQEWETTTTGMAQSTAQTKQAMDSFFASRSAGKTSSTVFYANANAVNTNALQDVSKDVSLYVVGNYEEGFIEIKKFLLTKVMEYLKGAAFYQLTKTEARVGPEKLIVIRDQTTGKYYSGPKVREMLGISTTNNARIHPGDHGKYDIFIQSESTNRKLVPGTGVLYWKAIGKPFKEEDEPYLKEKQAQPKIIQLPTVTPTNRPTPSPIPKGIAASKPKVQYFPSRDAARASGKAWQDAGRNAPKGQRWYVEA